MTAKFHRIDLNAFTLPGFEIAKLGDGFQGHKNETTGELIPNCCTFHKNIFEQLKAWYEKEENSYERISQSDSNIWIEEIGYLSLPEKIVKQISMTEYVILKRKDNPDWYNAITEFIQANVESFGHPAYGLNFYLTILENLFANNQFDLPEEKQQRLIDYMNLWLKPSEADNADDDDLEILNSIYQQWLNYFPFSLSFFASLKPKYEKRLPIFKTATRNRYTGNTYFVTHTRKSLYEILINLTNSLLTEINSLKIHNESSIKDPQKIKLELILESRKLKLQDGYKSENINQREEYKKMIDNWFDDEKEFIDEIIPCLEVLSKKKNTKTERIHLNKLEDLFHNSADAEPCLNILRELDPPVIDMQNRFMGKNKGIFPLWIKILKNHHPTPIIKHFDDIVYKDVLNLKIGGLNLTNDASEFRKEYKRLKTNKIDLDIKTKLSQLSQSGKLGK